MAAPLRTGWQALRRRLLLSALGLPWAGRAAAGIGAAEGLVPLVLPSLKGRSTWRIAFGSCARQNKPQPIWDAITEADPDLFLFMGDNLYADAQDETTLAERYAEFAQVAPLQAFRARVPHLAIWDDHDYGDDDVGGDYPLKHLSQRLFCNAWREPADSPRRTRPGVYQSYLIEQDGRRVQIILPDLRFNRSPLQKGQRDGMSYEAYAKAAVAGGQSLVGPYVQIDDPKASLLGEPQWAWLEAQLRVPADLRILGSSIQLAAEATGWEHWWNFPHERERLTALIRKTRANGLVVVSGDMHYGEVSRLDVPGGYPLWDITSSGLTEVWAVPTPNRTRASGVVAEVNFGMIEIDWRDSHAMLELSIRDLTGQVKLSTTVSTKDLRLLAA